MPKLLKDRHFVAGLLLIAAGSAIALHTMANYDVGTLRRMGPGLFPLWMGLTLMGLGLAIGSVACLRPHREAIPLPALRPFGAVLTGVLLFSLVVTPFGMVPAIFALTVAAVLADRKLGVVGTLILATGLSALAVLIFRFILTMPLEPFRWPF